MTRELLSFTSVNQPRGFLEGRKAGLDQKIPQSSSAEERAVSYFAEGREEGGEGEKSHFGLPQLKIWGNKAPPTPCHPFLLSPGHGGAAGTRDPVRTRCVSPVSRQWGHNQARARVTLPRSPAIPLAGALCN